MSRIDGSSADIGHGGKRLSRTAKAKQAPDLPGTPGKFNYGSVRSSGPKAAAARIAAARKLDLSKAAPKVDTGRTKRYTPAKWLYRLAGCLVAEVADHGIDADLCG